MPAKNVHSVRRKDSAHKIVKKGVKKVVKKAALPPVKKTAKRTAKRAPTMVPATKKTAKRTATRTSGEPAVKRTATSPTRGPGITHGKEDPSQWHIGARIRALIEHPLTEFLTEPLRCSACYMPRKPEDLTIKANFEVMCRQGIPCKPSDRVVNRSSTEPPVKRTAKKAGKKTAKKGTR
jgi:hypothetical protein